VNLSPAVLRQLETEGHIEAESNPLHLPRHSIRVILSLAFAGLAVYLYRSARLFDPQPLSILGVVFAYLLGVSARGLWSWARGGRPSRWSNRWEDFKAATVVIVLAFTSTAYLCGRADLVPHQLLNATLGLVLFYFGSR
jgi:hypothetical protein